MVEGQKSEVQGEGNYDAAREYDEKTTEFAKDKDRVEQAAKEAKDAVNSDERDELEEAEAEGREKAKS
ncbi:MAG: hypothetical protein ABI668_02825 [Sphingorhabdus sp.]